MVSRVIGPVGAFEEDVRGVRGESGPAGAADGLVKPEATPVGRTAGPERMASEETTSRIAISSSGHR